MSYSAIHTFPTALSEPSGLCRSGQYPDWYWMQRDGNRPTIYAVKIVGGVIQDLGGGVFHREFKLQQGGVNMAMTDFEDICLNPVTGQIVIADVGDNAHNRNGTNRPRPYICTFSEPDPTQGANGNVEVGPKYQLVWPDNDATFNRRFPDCESLFFLDGRYYLISKEGLNLSNEGDQHPRIVKLPATLDSQGTNTLTYVTSLTPLAGDAKSVAKPMWAAMSPFDDRLAVGITGGAVSATGNGHHLAVWDIPAGSEGLTGDALLIAMAAQEPTLTKEWRPDGVFYSMEAGDYVAGSSRDLVLASDNSRKLYYWTGTFYGDTALPPEGAGGCYLGCATPNGDLVRLGEVETELGRTYDVFSTYETDGAFPTATLLDCIANGRKALFHKRRPTVTWLESANGDFDAYWDADAQAIKDEAANIRAAGMQVWIGSDHEAAGSGYDTKGGSADHSVAGPRFAAHFENMWDRYNAILGADMDLVRFVVSTSSFTIYHPDNYFQHYIPAAGKFDYVGYTTYNNGTVNVWRTALDTLRGWHNWPSGGTPAYTRLATLAPGKPIIVVECSSSEQTTAASIGKDVLGKRNWYLDAATDIQTLPNILGFIQWDSNLGQNGLPDASKSWKVNTKITSQSDTVTEDFDGDTFIGGYAVFALSAYMNNGTGGALPPPPQQGSYQLRRVHLGSDKAAKVKIGDQNADVFF